MGVAQLEYCPRCRGPVPDVERYCPACTYDIGPPNVRESGSSKEVDALRKRVNSELENAKKRKCFRWVQSFSDCIRRKSIVVVAMPASVARQLVSEPKTIYQSYELLVGAGRRIAATAENDRHRAAVSSLLFGTYGSKIRYGALSLASKGLPTYGAIACVMRPIAIQDRVSFLETNSYKFVEAHKILPGVVLPPGHRAVWSSRHLLAVAKLARKIEGNGTDSDWQKMLLFSEGSDRGKDDFIEAHIFEWFTVDAIEDMIAVPEKNRTKGTSVDIRIALEKFAALKRMRK